VLGHTLTAEAFGDVASIVLVDSHESALSARAAVVLPSRTFLEKSGEFTNSAGLVQKFNAVVEPEFEAWSEADTLAQIAAAAGVS
jgi:NADH dehydrogenase/NADH:ubiquinone oxidoreductase subunit G